MDRWSTASSRLTLTQAFNSLGTTIAPTLGGLIILSGVTLSASDFAAMTPADLLAFHAKEAAAVQGPYLALAAALFALAVLFALVKLPKISHETSAQTDSSTETSVFQYRHLVLGATS